MTAPDCEFCEDSRRSFAPFIDEWVPCPKCRTDAFLDVLEAPICATRSARQFREDNEEPIGPWSSPNPPVEQEPGSLGPCLACGQDIASCMRQCERTDRGCCKRCAHDTARLPSGEGTAQ